MEYITNSNFEKLGPVLEECAEWFSQIAVSVAYPDRDTKLDKISPPDSFKQWLFEAAEQDDFDKNVISDAHRLYTDMVEAGSKIVEKAIAGKKPRFSEFDNLKGLYNGFVSRIRNLEKGSVLSGTGVCPETGLRTQEAIIADQKKEMERLKRQGTNFCLLMVRIDEFAKDASFLNPAVGAIKKCMRAFDDGYYLGQGYFLLSLKQTDIIGAEAAAERLQLILREDNPNEKDITVSYCLAEPVEDDEIKLLLDNMRADLNSHASEKDVALKFIEISPLQKYMKSIQGEQS